MDPKRQMFENVMFVSGVLDSGIICSDSALKNTHVCRDYVDNGIGIDLFVCSFSSVLIGLLHISVICRRMCKFILAAGM